ncbi:hypothetical protein B0H13DRAFT_1893174 [Mycena leptocephala]|nr:hypothetical protein B0H13DRAFT_1893174 [Mycena leptocephala]
MQRCITCFSPPPSIKRTTYKFYTCLRRGGSTKDYNTFFTGYFYMVWRFKDVQPHGIKCLLRQSVDEASKAWEGGIKSEFFSTGTRSELISIINPVRDGCILRWKQDHHLDGRLPVGARIQPLPKRRRRFSPGPRLDMKVPALLNHMQSLSMHLICPNGKDPGYSVPEVITGRQTDTDLSGSDHHIRRVIRFYFTITGDSAATLELTYITKSPASVLSHQFNADEGQFRRGVFKFAEFLGRLGCSTREGQAFPRRLFLQKGFPK